MSTARQAQDLLDQIAVAAGKKVETLILDMRDDINQAITATIEDAQEEANKTKEGKRAVLTLPVSIKWDLDTRAVQVSLAVNIKSKATQDIVLDDPAQHRLPLIDADGDAMPETTAEAVRKFAKTVRDAGATVTVATNTEDAR